MEGVRILNEISPMLADIWFLIGSFLAIGVLLLLSIITLDKGSRFIPILVSLILFVIVIILYSTKYNSPMKYEVTIDDNVKISEFEKKYKIIKKRGDIYVVEEIENNER